MGCTVIATDYTSGVEAITIFWSDVTIVGGRVVGAPYALYSHAGPAIDMFDGGLVLAGRDAVVEAGLDLGGWPVPAIRTQAGRVNIDPAVTLLPQNGSPRITGPATVNKRRIPSVRGVGLTSGAT